MLELAFPVFFGLVFLFVVGGAILSNRLSIVWADTEYPNNHYVEGVGYFHAAHGRWFEHPWNEFREDLGYYWNGEWHSEPDQQLVATAKASPAEILRVNQAWCAADPKRKKTWSRAVKCFGFGINSGRREGR